MKKRNAKIDASLIVELLCCLLGTTAVCTALLPALGQEVNLGDCMLLAAVDLSLIFLFSRRWWFAPALIGALVLCGLAVVQYFKLWEPVWEYVGGFIDWVSASCPYTQPYSENGSIFLLRLAFAFPAALILYLYFRRFAVLPLWGLLSGGLLVWMYFSDPENMLSVAALLMIVMIVLFARTNARSINRKLGLSEKIPASAMQITALVIAPFLVLFSFGIGPKEDGEWQSEPLVHFVDDLGDVITFYREGASSGGSFNLSYSGLTPNGSTLGGDIEPDNRTVLRVKTDTPLLLTGAVYDGYNGYGWYDQGPLGRFRLDSVFWRGKKREIFATDKPASAAAAALFRQVSQSATLEISMNVNFRSLFSAGKLESLTLRGNDGPDIYFNSQGELYTLDFPESALSYTVKTHVFDRESEGYDENMRALVQAAASARDQEYDEVIQRCTAIPETVEPFVLDLAEEITADCDNDYDKALALEKWIGDNCEYTQTPGSVPEGRDFVSYFLESREGYCTYYASAMTILARAVGLPARYATGYGLKQADRREDTNAYVATNATAHAWTQVYFRGVGWVDFDPSSWDFYELVALGVPREEEKEEEEEKEPIEPPEMIDPSLLFPELLQPELPEPGSPSAPARRTVNTGRILLIFLLCDLGAFLLFLLVRFVLLFFRTESFYRRLQRKYPDNGTRADVCYRQILKQLAFLGLEMEPSDTIMSFCGRVDEALADEREHDLMAEVCEPVQLSRFAMREPGDEELRRMCDFYIFLERSLRKRLGVRKYILHRMILGR